jgi:hypothetical protein
MWVVGADVLKEDVAEHLYTMSVVLPQHEFIVWLRETRKH